jgi:intracellular septation protein
MPPAQNPLLKLAIEVGPLAAFFLAYAKGDLYLATATFMVAAAVALAAGWLLQRRVAIMPVVSLAVVMVFGGLTLWLHDETFFKMKPTIVNGLFAAVLFGGLAVGRPLLRPVLGAALELNETGWRKLTWRWAWFFVALALLNELVWRTLSTDAWVTFKVFGIMPLTFLFLLTQVPLIRRHGT